MRAKWIVAVRCGSNSNWFIHGVTLDGSFFDLCEGKHRLRSSAITAAMIIATDLDAIYWGSFVNKEDAKASIGYTIHTNTKGSSDEHR